MTDQGEVTVKIPGEMLEHGPVTVTLTLAAKRTEPAPPLPANSPAAEGDAA